MEDTTTSTPDGALAYEREEADWRLAREKRVCGPLGWRSVSGLYWLPEGLHRCGAGAGATIPLPRRAGVAETALQLEVGANGHVRVRATPEAVARYNDAPFEVLALQASPHGVDAIYVQGFMIEIMRRGPGVGARVRDTESERAAKPCPVRWFPPRRDWRVRARLVPDSSLSMSIVNVLGDEEMFASPGHYVFELEGRTHRLTPFLETPDSSTLFFVFRDRTNGRETYGAGRFLFAKNEREIVLDFNRAVSPPCAYTDYATCPLTPACNVLDLRVDAGERTPADDAHAPA